MKGFTSTHRRCLHSPVTIGHVCRGFLHEDLVWRASASAVRSLFSMFWNHWTICWVSLGPAAFGRVFAGAAVQPWRQTLLRFCLPPALVIRRGDGFYLICNNKKKNGWRAFMFLQNGMKSFWCRKKGGISGVEVPQSAFTQTVEEHVQSQCRGLLWLVLPLSSGCVALMNSM